MFSISSQLMSSLLILNISVLSVIFFLFFIEGVTSVSLLSFIILDLCILLLSHSFNRDACKRHTIGEHFSQLNSANKPHYEVSNCGRKNLGGKNKKKRILRHFNKALVLDDSMANIMLLCNKMLHVL